MASVVDYGKVAGDKLNAPKLGGTDGWAAAIAAALNNSDTTVDVRISTAVTNHTDTDAAPTSKHHTLGTGANQASAGNHAHAGVYALTSHVHVIGDLPTGTTGTTVAFGNHTHAGVYEISGAVATHAATAGHELLSSTTPAVLYPDITSVVGVGTTTARSDHTHGLLAGTPTTPLSPATTDSEGVAASIARSDHTHALAISAPVALGAANAAGTAAYLARSDHVHIYPTLVQLGAAATSHVHVIGDLPTGTSGTTVAIGNHTHSYEASGAIATHDALATAHSALRGTVAPLKIQIGSAAAVGTSTKFAREDHLHDVSYGTPVALGAANAAGNASTFAASNHVHIFPTAADVGAATTGYVDSRAEVAVSNTQPATRDNLDIWINPSASGDVVANTYLPLAGGTMTGNLNMAADKNINAYAGASGGGAYLNQLEVYEGKAQFYRGAYTAIVPVASGDLTNKTYVDSRIWFGTLAAYNAIGTKDPLVLYVVNG